MTTTKKKYHCCNCSSCGNILTIERLIEPKVGCNIDVCIQCLTAAFEEVLREQKILPKRLQQQLEETSSSS